MPAALERFETVPWRHLQIVQAARCIEKTKLAKRRILVSKDTVELCGERFEFVSCGTFPVKGRAQPVELFEPRAAVKERGDDPTGDWTLKGSVSELSVGIGYQW